MTIHDLFMNCERESQDYGIIRVETADCCRETAMYDRAWMKGFWTDQFKQVFAGVKLMQIEIDAVGGIAAHALGMRDALTEFPAEKRFIIRGKCHSAASLLLLPHCWTAISPQGSIYIHEPRRIVWHKADTVEDLQMAAEHLSVTRDLMVRLYMRKTEGGGLWGIDQAGWLDMMKKGRTFKGKEAVEAGFADEVLDA